MQQTTLKQLKGSFDLCRLTMKSLSKLDITPTAKLVLIELCDHYPKVFPSQEYIANQLGVSIRQVKDSILQLKNLNIILVTKKKSSNHYYFSNAFFALVGCEICTLPSAESAPSCINKQKNKQKNNVFSFSKDAGVNHKSPETTREEIKQVYDVSDVSIWNDYETAVKWLSELSELELKLPPIQKTVGDIKQKWLVL